MATEYYEARSWLDEKDQARYEQNTPHPASATLLPVDPVVPFLYPNRTDHSGEEQESRRPVIITMTNESSRPGFGLSISGNGSTGRQHAVYSHRMHVGLWVGEKTRTFWDLSGCDIAP